jgi:transposase
MTKKQTQGKGISQMPIVNQFAAGIDIGSKFHYVAIGQEKGQVRRFGSYTHELHELCKWLVESNIRTVALESTGSYWRPLFILLQDYQLNPILVNGKFTKNVSGKKTDVLDCQWIQKMHSLGLLEGSFIPDLFTEKIRQYWRHRQTLVDGCAAYKNKIQKALRLMNIRLDSVITEVTGLSGKAIITAILSGERDAHKLANLAHDRVKKSKEEVAFALTGDWRDEYVFELRHCYELYCYYQEKIAECDKEIQIHMQKEINIKGSPVQEFDGKQKRLRRNDPDIDLQLLSYRLSGGIDLSKIEGVGIGTIMTLISEVGFDMKSFPTAKQFVSWLRLAPNTRITGGKVISSRTKAGKNRLAEAFRHAANGVGNIRKGGMLHQFFKRIEYRKGRISAIVAAARKLAVIVWTMGTKKMAYNPVPTQEYVDKMRQNQLRHLRRKIRQLSVRPDDIDFVANTA